MADTVIFPLSESTGRGILTAVQRIALANERTASALERIAASMGGGGGGESTSSVTGTTLTTSGSVTGRTLTTGSGASVTGRTLSL